MRAKTKIYHIDCFRCTACERHLIPGDEFALRDDGLFCKADHEHLDGGNAKAGLGAAGATTTATGTLAALHESNNNNAAVTNNNNNSSLNHNEGSNSGKTSSITEVAFFSTLFHLLTRS